jgi:hypothetical protein
MSRIFAWGLWTVALLAGGLPARAQQQLPDELTLTESTWAPDTPEPGSVEAIRRHTTSPEFLPPAVAYLPESATVPSPIEVLGRVPGAAEELSSVAQIHDYMRRLGAASDRVDVRVIGTSEEEREILLVLVSAPENLQAIDRLSGIAARLADPRRTSREAARRLAAEGKAFYYLLGGLHSTETGSPEMLMELAYRLATSERPEIQRIRESVVVMMTPVVEVDGRDRVVEWYYRHLRGRDGPYERLREFSSPPYWGHYAYHDNNRDGMQLALALTRAVHGAFYDFHPQIVHDLHESLPLLYISTGHGPYNRAISPVTINEWTQFAHHEASALQAAGLPGVWTWAFWDGWWPGYLFSVANNHNATGRFYETFGNSLAGTFTRHLEEIEYLGKPVTTIQWYRPWPPDSTVRWSLRNNTNFMQAGVLEALEYASLHADELLSNFHAKGELALERGRTEPPYAWLFPTEQDDPARLAFLINQLRKHRIEVHRLTEPFAHGDSTYPAGTYVVRMDQPYRNAAIMFLEAQKFPEDEPNPPYDDVAWTWPLLYGVEGRRIDDRTVQDAAMATVAEEVRAQGEVAGAGDVYLLADRGQTALLAARVRLGEGRVEAAERAFASGVDSFPAGSWIVRAPRRTVEAVAGELGLEFVAVPDLPDVPRHTVDLPRLGVYYPWVSTQDAGWARYTLDQVGVPYRIVTDQDLRRGGLADRFDVLLLPNAGGDFARLVHGIDPAHGPLAYNRTREFPSHGIPVSSPDITGGMGFQGLIELQEYLADGGTVVAIANAGRILVDGGLVRRVDRASSGSSTPGSELRAKVLRPDHPLAYGYPDTTSVFRGNGPLWTVDDRLRDWVVLQFGTKKVEDIDAREAREEETAPDEPPYDGVEPTPEAAEPVPDMVQPPDFGMPIEAEGEAEPAREEPAAGADGESEEDAQQKTPLLLSGFVKEADDLEGQPAILDVPVGRGRVVLFAFNPLHRHLNHSDFRFAMNAILHWNDLPRP